MPSPQFGLWPPGATGGGPLLGTLTPIAAAICINPDAWEFADLVDPDASIAAITSFGTGDFQIELSGSVLTPYPAATQWYPVLEVQDDVPLVAVGKMEPSGTGTGFLVLRVRVFDLAGVAANASRVTAFLYVNTTPGI